MSIRYAPYIEGTIPAFGTTLLVPYEMNRGVKLTDNITFVVKIMDLNNNNNIKYFTTSDAKLNPLPFAVSELIAGQYYKIQLAYSDGEENNKLIYSSVGIGKYFGNKNPTIANSNNSTYNSISYDANGSSEELYSLIITNSNNKELQELYIEQNQLNTGIVNLATEIRKIKAKTINSYITNSVYLEPSTFNEESIINSLLQNTDNEHIYLVSKDKTLCVKFNPKISSFKTTIQETKTETIGGKYPLFYRNGTLGYKEFPINGLISYHMDDNEKFMTKVELGLETEKSIRTKTTSGESAAALNIPTHNLVEYNITAERKFRNAVLDWLNNGEVKLFKSPTEGMFLVRLMNISLSPEEKLGRMLYSFSATAYEVGEINYENLVKYGFIDKIEGVDYVIR